jgi:hypothetical protein
MKHVLAGLALLTVAAASAAEAATLTATSVNPSLLSNFTVNFTDADGDGILEYREIDGFSGIEQFVNGQAPEKLDFLIGIPTIDGVSLAGGNDACAVVCLNSSWYFASAPDGTNALGIDFAEYDYNLSLGPSPIPLPASALLLGAGLGGLALFRRRRRAA